MIRATMLSSFLALLFCSGCPQKKEIPNPGQNPETPPSEAPKSKG